MNKQNDATDLLRRIGEGEREALDLLFPLVYEELRSTAHSALRSEREDHTFNTTALVHEAYLKLAGSPLRLSSPGRRDFLAVAAKAMRQVLIDYARARSRLKRRGKREHVVIDEEKVMSAPMADELVALDEALNRLEAVDRRQARIVEYRFIAGFTINETAELLGCSAATVNRDWTTARLWLNREISAILAADAADGLRRDRQG
ncbi:MAG TPA: ECF-type sigma factor [Rhodothermales bacterium]|nr:ECF-type sigma factor [Rhodothermales bacterium]